MQQNSEHRLRAAVVGYGAYGRLHARKYQQHPDVDLAAIVDSSEERRRQAETDMPGVATLATPDELAQLADIASVVVPARHHYRIASPLLEAGLQLLVEKPFTASLHEAHQLIAQAERRSAILQPGYLERFNLTLGELREHLPGPRYVEARRLTNWRGRGADVSVVHDLMIHDIDMLLEIVDSTVTHIEARGAKIVSDHWDVATARLIFANGCIANLTASRASPSAERRLHVFSDDACALADIDGGEMLVHQRSDIAPGVMTERRFCRHEDPLAAEIDSFVQAVRHHAVPLVSADDACRAMEIADWIVAAMEDDADIVTSTTMPMTNSEHAIAYLLENRRQSHGH